MRDGPIRGDLDAGLELAVGLRYQADDRRRALEHWQRLQEVVGVNFVDRIAADVDRDRAEEGMLRKILLRDDDVVPFVAEYTVVVVLIVVIVVVVVVVVVPVVVVVFVVVVVVVTERIGEQTVLEAPCTRRLGEWMHTGYDDRGCQTPTASSTCTLWPQRE